jgi:Flp pilus assembly protein TadD
MVARVFRVCLVSYIFIIFAAQAVGREPFLPANGSDVIETLPSAAEPQVLKRLRNLAQRLREQPGDEQLAIQVAREYVELAKAQQDPYYYGAAESALAFWVDAKAVPFAVLALRATIAQYGHDFERAVFNLRRGLRQHPAAAQAWFDLAVIELVRGEFAAARDGCTGLRAAGAITAAAICHAQVDALTGRSPKALVTFEGYIQQSKPKDQALLVWALTGYGELLQRLGRLQESEKAFIKARAIAPGDAYLLTAYCDLLLLLKKYNEVIRLTLHQTPNDNVLLRKALALKAINFSELSMATAPLKQGFDAARLRNTPVHQREEALYYLELEQDQTKALAAAAANFSKQKEPLDALLYLKAAKLSSAAEHIDAVTSFYRSSGLEDYRAEALLKP